MIIRMYKGRCLKCSSWYEMYCKMIAICHEEKDLVSAKEVLDNAIENPRINPTEYMELWALFSFAVKDLMKGDVL